jgi:hypothetical protein
MTGCLHLQLLTHIDGKSQVSNIGRYQPGNLLDIHLDAGSWLAIDNATIHKGDGNEALLEAGV